jgi:hypothetical protein
VLIHAGLALLIVGSAFDIIVGREHWPFSHYPMYSEVERDTLTSVKLHLYGVPAGAPGQEIYLMEQPFIQPFDMTRLNTALRRLKRRPAAEPLLREAVQDVADRYMRLQAAGRHDGPPLAHLRLYRLQWRLDPQLRNLAVPEMRDLVLEVDVAPSAPVSFRGPASEDRR